MAENQPKTPLKQTQQYNYKRYSVLQMNLCCAYIQAMIVTKQLDPCCFGFYFYNFFFTGSCSLICCFVQLSSLSSNTYQIVQENTDQYWCFQRYRLIYEYYTRPTLAPPLILISHLGLFIRWIFGKCSLCLSSQPSDLSKLNLQTLHFH